MSQKYIEIQNLKKVHQLSYSWYKFFFGNVYLPIRLNKDRNIFLEHTNEKSSISNGGQQRFGT